MATVKLTYDAEKHRIHGVRKPAMIGSVFASFAARQIGIRTLRRLNTAIEQLPARIGGRQHDGRVPEAECKSAIWRRCRIGLTVGGLPLPR